MMRDLIGKTTSFIGVMALLIMAMLPLTCGGQDLELIAPVVSETLQYRTDDFVIFFSPDVGDNGLAG